MTNFEVLLSSIERKMEVGPQEVQQVMRCTVLNISFFTEQNYTQGK